jgi:hypothetical protein
MLVKSKADASPIAPADSAAELSQNDVDIIADVLARWPSLQRFPGKQHFHEYWFAVILIEPH